MIKHILVATDFSPCAAAALDLAVEIAQGKRASVTLLHVFRLSVYERGRHADSEARHRR